MCSALSLSTLSALLFYAGETAAQAQPAVVLAPPLKSPVSTPPIPAGNMGGASATVFQWQDVPQNREVPITRAVFDQGGYQLFDDVGETIVVPFVGQNLFVMRFGRSATGGMYFVSDGLTPTLYLPADGYLENATAQGARWYPFPQDFRSPTPVYLCITPYWNDYEAIVWYPNTVVHGGYTHHEPKLRNAAFVPLPGFTIVADHHVFRGLSAYHAYLKSHPDPNQIAWDRPQSEKYHVPQRGTGFFKQAGMPHPSEPRSVMGATAAAPRVFARTAPALFGKNPRAATAVIPSPTTAANALSKTGESKAKKSSARDSAETTKADDDASTTPLVEPLPQDFSFAVMTLPPINRRPPALRGNAASSFSLATTAATQTLQGATDRAESRGARTTSENAKEIPVVFSGTRAGTPSSASSAFFPDEHGNSVSRTRTPTRLPKGESHFYDITIYDARSAHGMGAPQSGFLGGASVGSSPSAVRSADARHSEKRSSNKKWSGFGQKVLGALLGGTSSRDTSNGSDSSDNKGRSSGEDTHSNHRKDFLALPFGNKHRK